MLMQDLMANTLLAVGASPAMVQLVLYAYSNHACPNKVSSSQIATRCRHTPTTRLKSSSKLQQALW